MSKSTSPDVMLKYHGIEYPTSDNPGHFHFAISRFCGHLDHSYLWRFRDDPEPPPWPENCLDRRFSQSVVKLNDTFHKLLRVAGLVERARKDVGDYKTARKLSEYSKHLSALRDIPIYLDSILLYLRILGDCLATITPYFYGSRYKNTLSRRFSLHRKYFMEKRTFFDPTYTKILSQNTEWFEILAGQGRGKGLRDKIIHNRGTFQLSYTTDGLSQDTEITAGLVGDYGWICDNALPEIKLAVRGLFVFLDKYVEHFNRKVEEQTGTQPIDLTVAHQTEGFRFNQALDSFWLFPKIDSLSSQD